MVGCETINVFDLKYSTNPFDCKVLMFWICGGIAALALIAIFALCVYRCGKERGNKSKNGQHNTQERPWCAGDNFPQTWHYPSEEVNLLTLLKNIYTKRPRSQEKALC